MKYISILKKSDTTKTEPEELTKGLKELEWNKYVEYVNVAAGAILFAAAGYFIFKSKK